MPKSAPAKVAVSPKATRSVSWICPCGSIKTPQKSNISPPNDKMAAEMSCRCSVRITNFIYNLTIYDLRFIYDFVLFTI